MSDTDRESTLAFFPRVDRRISDELDRHLRDIPPERRDLLSDEAPGLDHLPSERPNINDILSSIKQAGANISALTSQNYDLNGQLYDAQAEIDRLSAQLDRARRLFEDAEAAITKERENVRRAEKLADHHQNRSAQLESELNSTLYYLQRVSEAIVGVLGRVEER